MLLYPGINPIQSLFNIVFLSQFLYTLVLFFCYFFVVFFLVLFFTVLCQILFAPLKFSPVLFSILSSCFFYCVPILFFLSLYSVGFATCKSILLSLLLYPFLTFPSTVLCRIFFLLYPGKGHPVRVFNIVFQYLLLYPLVLFLSLFGVVGCSDSPG